jgi:hypothetical protein
MRGAIRAIILGAMLWCVAGAAQAGAFSNWAVIVVAGDWHAHSGAPSEVFDNARKDLAHAFVHAGFSAENVRQFSVRPERYASEGVLKSDRQTVTNTLDELASRATGGCLVYFTSHGAPMGVLVNGEIWNATIVSQIIDDACGKRPTVVVISSCFSGALIDAVNGPNRMVLTAARPDRTSFGCGESDHYTFFDTCVLSQLPLVNDFPGLSRAVTACVAIREHELGLSPPSEPQTTVGGMLRPMLPLLRFNRPSG